jgi:hypothetical protein
LINFDPDDIQNLETTLMKDVNFLTSLELMDYSLLLIIIKNSDDEYFHSFMNQIGENYSHYKNRIFKSKNKKYIYCLGIIDYLQKFNMSKFLENKYKSIVYRKEAKFVSAVDPLIYSSRLVDFTKQYVFISNNI